MLLQVLSSYPVTSAPPGGMAGAELPGLGENSCQGYQEQHLLGMQQGHPRDLQGNQRGQLGLEGCPGTPFSVNAKCWRPVLRGLGKDPNILLFPDLFFFFLKFWVAGPSIFFFNKGQVNGVWNWMIFKDPCNSNHSITSTQPALPAICWVK